MASIQTHERSARLADREPRALRVRAFVLLVTGTLALQSIGIIAFNVAVNPRSEFPVDIVPPLVENERHQKTLAYSKLDPAPEAVIVGSSRSWTLPPDALEALGYHGAYNFAFGGGTTLDAARTYEFMIARGRAPKLLVYGFEDWQLDTTHDIPWTPAAEPSIASVLERLPDALHSLSLDYVRDSRRALEASWNDDPRAWIVQANGSVVWERAEAQKADGTWSVGAASEPFLAGARAHYAEGVSYEASRAEVLTTLVARARSHGTTIVLLLTPMHLEGRSLLSAPSYDESVSRARELLMAQCQAGARVYDLTDPASYGSDQGGFVDGWHFDVGEGRRILEHVRAAGDLCGHRSGIVE